MKILRNLILPMLNFIILVKSQMLDYSGKGWPKQCQGSQQSPIDFPADTSTYIPLNNTRILFPSYNILENVTLEILPFAKFAAKNDNMGELFFEKNGLVYKYQLNEIHFHYRAEHTFGGEEADLEMHMVHTKDIEFFLKSNPSYTHDPDSRNQKLVIAILFDRNAKSNNLDGSLDNPLITKLKFNTLETIDSIDLNEFARRDRLFLHYEGSLSTPTCNEIVNWIVMTQFESISDEQLNDVYRLIKANGYSLGNHRPTQLLNGRPIFYNDIYSIKRVEVTSFAVYLNCWTSFMISMIITMLFNL